MEGQIIAAAVTVVAALASLFGVIYTHRKASENSRVIHAASEQHEKQITQLTARLEQAVFTANSVYTKKLDVLAAAYSMLGEICFLVESFLVPYTEYSSTGLQQAIKDACLKFEELRKYHLQHAIFFDSDDKLGPSMGVLMGQLNTINNLQNSFPNNTPANVSNKPSLQWQQQVKAFQTKIEPAIHSVKEQFRRTLNLSGGNF